MMANQLPGPGEVFLDHTAFFVPAMEAAAGALERCGFRLTPFTVQTNREGGATVPSGTGNRCAMLRNGYLEVLTATSETPLSAQLRRERCLRCRGQHFEIAVAQHRAAIAGAGRHGRAALAVGLHGERRQPKPAAFERARRRLHRRHEECGVVEKNLAGAGKLVRHHALLSLRQRLQLMFPWPPASPRPPVSSRRSAPRARRRAWPG